MSRLTLAERLARSEDAQDVALEQLLLDAREVATTRGGRRDRDVFERLAARLGRHLRDMGCTCLDDGPTHAHECPVHTVPF